MQGRISMSLITSITLVRLVAERVVQDIKARRFGSSFDIFSGREGPPSALRARFLDDGSVALEESIMVRTASSPMEGLEC